MTRYPALLLLLLCTRGLAQEVTPSGTTPARSWWNLLRYDITVHPDYAQHSIAGSNNITLQALRPGQTLQIDLQAPMRITTASIGKNALTCTHQGNAWMIRLPHPLKKGQKAMVRLQFEGTPQAAARPPFESGWVWTKDRRGRPWISLASEGSGASIWLPCKDVLYDEPDSGISFSITVPDTLVAVAEGRLAFKRANSDNTVTYRWEVKNPINNYSIVPYIGKYVTWHAKHNNALDEDFWVLDYNLDKARSHFRQTDTLLKCFEYWLGPYPFYQDGYKIVEAPMPGMEHQSGIAYGNGFANSYGGRDLSGSGWGMKWDFILVHESGHEWFGNSITAALDGESWIHEGFTKYLEVLYTDFVFGREAGNDYATGLWKRIKNDAPVVGSGSSDTYYKASAMLHMIRQITGDSVFRDILRGLNRTFYHQTVTTTQVLGFINAHAGRNLSKVFEQYLYSVQVPVLEYGLINGVPHYRWAHCVEGFDMPVRLQSGRWLYPSTRWQETDASPSIDRNFYIHFEKIEPQ
jgi:aminopeptidase N